MAKLSKALPFAVQGPSTGCLVSQSGHHLKFLVFQEFLQHVDTKGVSLGMAGTHSVEIGSGLQVRRLLANAALCAVAVVAERVLG